MTKKESSRSSLPELNKEGSNFDEVELALRSTLELKDTDKEDEVRANNKEVFPKFVLSITRAELLDSKPDLEVVKSLLASTHPNGVFDDSLFPVNQCLDRQLKRASQEVRVLIHHVAIQHLKSFPAHVNASSTHVTDIWAYLRAEFSSSTEGQTSLDIDTLFTRRFFASANELFKFIRSGISKLKKDVSKFKNLGCATSATVDPPPYWINALIMFHLPQEERKRLDFKLLDDPKLFEQSVRQKCVFSPTKRSREESGTVNNVLKFNKKSKFNKLAAESSGGSSSGACFVCKSSDHQAYKYVDKVKVMTCPNRTRTVSAIVKTESKPVAALLEAGARMEIPFPAELELCPDDLSTTVLQNSINNVSAVSKVDVDNNCYVIDSGSGVHLSKTATNVSSGKAMNLRFPNNTGKRVCLRGSLFLNKLNFEIKNVVVDPNFGINILSEYQLQRDGIKITNSECGEFKTLTCNGKSLQAYQQNGVYMLSPEVNKSINAILIPSNMNELAASKIAKYLHLVFGHVSQQVLITMLKNQTVIGLPQVDINLLRKVKFDCSVCAVMKQKRMSYKNLVGERSDEPCHTVHTDTREIETAGSLNGKYGYKYSLNIVDDCTSYKWIFPLRKKTEARERLKTWKAMVETQYGCTVKILRTDGGTHEYFNPEIRKFCEENGLIHQSSNAYCQSENGAAERYNAVDAAYIRTLLASVGFPAYMWPEAQRHGVYLDNRTPKRRLGWITPYECLTNKKAKIIDLPIFGSLLTAFIPAELRKQKTLGKRAVKARFLGVEEQYKAFRIWDIDNSIVTHSRSVKINKTFISDLFCGNFDANAHLSFEEALSKNVPKGGSPLKIKSVQALTDDLPNQVQSEVVLEASLETGSDDDICVKSVGDLKPSAKSAGVISNTDDLFEPPNGTIHLQEILENYPSLIHVDDGDSRIENAHRFTASETSDNPTLARSVQPKLRKSARETRRPKRHEGYIGFIDHDELTKDAESQGYVVIPEPRTVREALMSKEAASWRKSIDTEYQALLENNTWDLVPLPKGRKAIKSKWIFKVKYHADGSIDKFKSRLCVVGCMQRSGLDYNEVFSPVCRLESLRVFLALSAALDLHLHQLDITTAFLHADIDEEVFMEQPVGTVCNKIEQWVQ